MRYLFKGLTRATGKPVEGHVEAENDELAYQMLGENGIIASDLKPDPKPLNLNNQQLTGQAAGYANAIDSAMDSSSTQVNFDSLMDRYRGKKVWVIDRDKIRTRVAQVVDAVLSESQRNADDAVTTRALVADAIQGMFRDNQNIASQRNSDGSAATAPRGPAGAGIAASPRVDAAMDRLERMLDRMESLLARLALRGGGGGGGVTHHPRQLDEKQNEVLLEIFKSNLELVRSMDEAAIQQQNTATTEPSST